MEELQSPDSPAPTPRDHDPSETRASAAESLRTRPLDTWFDSLRSEYTAYARRARLDE